MLPCHAFSATMEPVLNGDSVALCGRLSVERCDVAASNLPILSSRRQACVRMVQAFGLSPAAVLFFMLVAIACAVATLVTVLPVMATGF